MNKKLLVKNTSGGKKIKMLKYLCTLGISFLLYGCPVYDPPAGSLDIFNYTDSAI
jgi:hypothetical protein